MAETILHVLGSWMFQLVFGEDSLREVWDEGGECDTGKANKVARLLIRGSRWFIESRRSAGVSEICLTMQWKPKANSRSFIDISFVYQKDGVRIAGRRARIQYFTYMVSDSA